MRDNDNPFEDCLQMTNYIKAEDLKDGYLYRIDARRAEYGIWIKKRGTFLISRVKFGCVFLFEERHYDLDDFSGTAKPIKELEKAPFQIERLNNVRRNDKEVLEYLMAKEHIDPNNLKEGEFYL